MIRSHGPFDVDQWTLFPRLIDELFPGEAAVIDDIVIGFEDTVGEPVVAQELPDILDRVQFGHRGGSGMRVVSAGTTISAEPCHPA